MGSPNPSSLVRYTDNSVASTYAVEGLCAVIYVISGIEVHINVFNPNSVVKFSCHFVLSGIWQLSVGGVFGWESIDYTEAFRLILYT